MHERGPTVPTEVFSGTGVAEPRPLKIKARYLEREKSVVEVCLHVHDKKVRSIDESLIYENFWSIIFTC